MPSLPTWLNWKSLLRWLVVAIGTLLGFFILLALDRFDISRLDIDQERYAFAGFLLLGLSWFIASLVAIRNQRLAARILLVTALPITFCVTSIDANPSGTVAGEFIPVPSLASCVILILCFLPLYLPLFARGWRRALILFSASTLIVAACLALPPLRLTSRFLLPTLASASIFFSILGYFWVVAYKLNWPPLLQPKPIRSPARRIAKISVAVSTFATIYLVCLISISLLFPRVPMAECKYSPPFTQPRNSLHAAFTARIVYLHPDPNHSVRGDSAAYSAIGVVEHNFWGAPRWPWHLVFLTGTRFVEGEIYFFEGERSGLISRFLPLEVAHPCGWTRQAGYAALELHLLNHPPAKPSIITGQVYRSKELTSGRIVRPPYPGATVVVSGPTGSITATTDTKGIYEVDGLAPADYKVSVALPDTEYAAPDIIPMLTLQASPIISAEFSVTSNGSLEGRVTNSAGQPVEVRLYLERSDGADDPFDRSPSFALRASLRTDPRGFFHFDHTPEGDYRININPTGLDKNRHYESTLSAPIHLAPAQHISRLSLHTIPAKR